MNDQLQESFMNILEDLLCTCKDYNWQYVLSEMVDDYKVLPINNHIIGVIFMDMSKAFDCTPHGPLITKLWAGGLSENACDLLASCL